MPVSAAISGLTTGSTYHFRLVATSDAGHEPRRRPDASRRRGAAGRRRPGRRSSVTSTRRSSTAASTRTASATTLVLRVRHDHELRHEDGSPQTPARARTTSNVSATVTGLAAGRRTTSGSSPRATPGTTLRQRPDASAARGPPSSDRLGQSALARPAHAHRLRQPERRVDDLVLRVRDEHRLRHEDDVEERGLGHRGGAASRRRSRTSRRHDLPLPPRRLEQRGTTHGRDVDVHDGRRDSRSHVVDAQVVYGHVVNLSGTVASGQTGVRSRSSPQPFGAAPRSRPLATVLTGAGGSWTLPGAAEDADRLPGESPDGGTSTPVTIGVRPAVSLPRHHRAPLHDPGRRREVVRRQVPCSSSGSAGATAGSTVATRRLNGEVVGDLPRVERCRAAPRRSASR